MTSEQLLKELVHTLTDLIGKGIITKEFKQAREKALELLGEQRTGDEVI